MKLSIKWPMILSATVIAIIVIAIQFNFIHADGPWYVAPEGNNSADCLSPLTPCATIAGALAKTAPGDTIHVAVGVYTSTLEAVVEISKSVVLSGGWDLTFATQTGMSTLDGEGARQVLNVSGSTVVLERFIIRNGGNVNGGGGVFVSGSQLSMYNCAVLDNWAQLAGGGILADYSWVNLNNVTVARNTSALDTGGIHLVGWGSSCVVTINNSTVVGNTAKSGFVGGINNWAATVYMQNTIVAGNIASSAPDCYGAITSQGYNLLGNSSGCSWASSTGDTINTDPLLIPLVAELGFYPLYANSPAVDQGNPSGCADHLGHLLTTDQRGVMRSDRCDIGAYEKVAAGTLDAIYVMSGTPQSTTVKSLFPDPLALIAVDSIGSPVSDTLVLLSAPPTGASARFTDSESFTTTLMTNESGIVTTPLRANESPGRYTVTAIVSGAVTPFDFSLINIGQVFLPAVFRNYCPDFLDDFSNPASGWPVGEDSYVRSEYLSGEYRVLSKKGGYLYLFPAPACQRENYIVEVDARWQGTPGNSYGLLFGVKDSFSYYYLFDLNTDYQQFRLYRRSPSGFTEIVAPTYSAAIRSGAASNRLKVIRDGYHITLYVNDSILGAWWDNGIMGLSGAGVVASSYTNAPTSDARFDNFSMMLLTNNVMVKSVNEVAAPTCHPYPVRSYTEPVLGELDWREASPIIPWQ